MTLPFRLAQRILGRSQHIFQPLNFKLLRARVRLGSYCSLPCLVQRCLQLLDLCRLFLPE